MATTKTREKTKRTVGKKKGTLPGGATPSDMRKIMNHSLVLQGRGRSKSASMKEAWRKFKAGEL